MAGAIERNYHFRNRNFGPPPPLAAISGDKTMAMGVAFQPWAEPGQRYGKATAKYRPTIQGGTMSLQSHIEVLKERHANLDTRIHQEDCRPKPDDGEISKLKLEKLRLKEEMERLSGR
jgi:hypothetical protein